MVYKYLNKTFLRNFYIHNLFNNNKKKTFMHYLSSDIPS